MRYLLKNSAVAIGLIFTALSLSACSKEERQSTSEKSARKDTGQADRSNEKYATLRQHSLSEEKSPPQIAPQINKDLRAVRNYPEQPPVIPHKIEDYQVDARHNQCLDCHSRTAVANSQAPMVSISHFMNRDGQSLASISPRRYFCVQCHVPQHDTEPLVENDFVDVDKIIKTEK